MLCNDLGSVTDSPDCDSGLMQRFWCHQASKDVLAMASLEVDLTKIEPGQTITVKWRGKPVFIKRRTEEDIDLANQVNVKELRDPQTDSERTQNPEVRRCSTCLL